MKKINKKGYVFSGALVVLLIVIGVVVIIPLLVSGGLSVGALNKIPAPVWVALALLLLFNMGKKK